MLLNPYRHCAGLIACNNMLISCEVLPRYDWQQKLFHALTAAGTAAHAKLVQWGAPFRVPAALRYIAYSIKDSGFEEEEEDFDESVMDNEDEDMFDEGVYEDIDEGELELYDDDAVVAKRNFSEEVLEDEYNDDFEQDSTVKSDTTGKDKLEDDFYENIDDFVDRDAMTDDESEYFYGEYEE